MPVPRPSPKPQPPRTAEDPPATPRRPSVPMGPAREGEETPNADKSGQWHVVVSDEAGDAVHDAPPARASQRACTVDRGGQGGYLTLIVGDDE